MKISKRFKGEDGEERLIEFDSEGYIFYKGKAKDFQDKTFIIGNHKLNYSAQDLLDEI